MENDEGGSWDAEGDDGDGLYEEITAIDYDSLDPFGLCDTLIDDRYQALRVVGVGGFAIVYQGVDRVLERPVAIKCLKLPGRLKETKRPKLIQQLLDEGKILARLSREHSAIVMPFDVGSLTTSAGMWVPYLVLEWLSGTTLTKHIRKASPMPLYDALQMLKPVAEALALAHESRVAHRDIKPDNLFLTELGRGERALKVLDFGIAKALSDQQVFAHNYTKRNLFVPFTPAYGAPEQFDIRRGATGPWTDVFALALVLVEMVTGRPPLGEGTPFDLGIVAVDPRARPTPRARGAKVSDEVEAIMAKALHVALTERYQDAASFWTELVQACNGHNATPVPPSSIELMYVFSEQDEDLRQDFEQHVVPRLDDVIDTFTPRALGESAGWAGKVHPRITEAGIIVVMVSQALIDTGYLQDVEVKKALELHDRRAAHVVPLRLRATSGGRSVALRRLVAIPRFGVPLALWLDPQEGWKDVAESLHLIARERRSGVAPQIYPTPRPRIHQVGDVFKDSGSPDVNFVETTAYRHLKGYLRIPGRGVVIEGPSGVGKTTALGKAIRDLGKEPAGLRGPTPVMLTARKLEDQKRIDDIESWHREGMVAIDDFHRLDERLALRVANYMKCLADEDVREKKLVVVGIPGSGQKLINFGYDLAMRVDVLRLGRVDSKDVMRMIEKGEEALRIRIDRKSDIAMAAAGSFNIAQFLCQHICVSADVNETQMHVRDVPWTVPDVMPRLLEKLSMKYRSAVSRFGGLGGRKDITAVQILKELPGCEDGFLSLTVLSGVRGPQFADGINRLLDGGEMRSLFHDPEREFEALLSFDEKGSALIIEDPQLMFYLGHVSLRDLARLAGKGTAAGMAAQSRVLILYSRHDARWVEMIEKRFRARERQFDVAKEELGAGPMWRADLPRLLDQVAVLVLLVSDDARPMLDGADLAQAIDERSRAGMLVIPVLLSPSRGRDTQLARFAPINPDSYLSTVDSVKRESLISELARRVTLHLARANA